MRLTRGGHLGFLASMNQKKIEVPFTQVANNVLNDMRLSFKAKGLFAYLYSKPQDWQFESRRIARASTDGKKATRSAIKELEEIGLLRRIKQKDGRMTYLLSFQPVANVPKGHSAKRGHISNKDFSTNKEILVFKKKRGEKPMRNPDTNKFDDEYEKVIDYATGESKTKRPPVRQRKQPMKGPAPAFCEYYKELIKNRYKESPIFNQIACMKLYNDLLAEQFTDGWLRLMLTKYVASDDTFYRKNKWSLQVFLSKEVFNRLNLSYDDHGEKIR